MKCGNCKKWNCKPQPGTTEEDILKEKNMFGKVLGFCQCKEGGNYPFFDYEKCLFPDEYEDKEHKNSFHKKKDGRIFQMVDGFSGKPIPFSSAKHNYTRKDIDSLKMNQSIKFMPMFGNENPVYSTLIRIK